MAFRWPGNVRQLENVMERAFALSPGRTQITAIDLPDEIRDVRRPADADRVAIPDTASRWTARGGLRAHADPARARTHARQQAAGRRSAARQAHDADREAQTPRASTDRSAGRPSFWVILAAPPTSFRSSNREDLIPTLVQLQRTQPDVTLRWFERNRLWASPEEAQAAVRAARTQPRTRNREWRPGGEHKDPRARFKLPRAQKRARWNQRTAVRPSQTSNHRLADLWISNRRRPPGLWTSNRLHPSGP